MKKNLLLSSTASGRMTTKTKIKTKTVGAISSIAVIAIAAGVIIAAMSVSMSIALQPNNAYAQKNVVSKSCIDTAVATFKTSVNNAIAEFLKSGGKDTAGLQSAITAAQAALQKQLETCF